MLDSDYIIISTVSDERIMGKVIYHSLKIMLIHLTMRQEQRIEEPSYDQRWYVSEIWSEMTCSCL